MAKKTFKRLPNGFGSVVKLSGNRRKPWQARTPKMGETDTLSPIAFSLGCFETWQQAYDAVVEWHKRNDNAGDYRPRMTLGECFEKAMARAEKGERIAERTARSYQYGIKRFSRLLDKPIADITTRQIQTELDAMEGGRGALHVSLVAMKKAYKFALQNGLVDRDATEGTEIVKKAAAPKEDKFFTMDELAVLKSAAENGDQGAMLILVMCYSGFRPAAYVDMVIENDCFYGGVKTGKRYVPIYPKIAPWVGVIGFAHYNEIWRSVTACEKRLGIRHLSPHAARHTFRYLCYLGKVDPVVSRKLMGHSTGDIHDKVYAHAEIADLRKEVEKLPW